MDTPSTNDTVETVDSGLTPSTILGGCDDAQIGVSVENVYTPKAGYNWHVFRASYGRSDKAYTALQALAVECYQPRHTIYQRTPAGIKPLIRNMMPYFVLAYVTDYQARLFTRGPQATDRAYEARTDSDKTHIRHLNTLLSIYYDHCVQTGPDDTRNPPLTVPLTKMNNFILATLPQDNVIPVGIDDFDIGEEVEVVEGQFKGLIGRVMRKPKGKNHMWVQLTNAPVIVPPPYRQRQGRQRLYFQVPCLGSFGSAYIPTAYFKRLDDDHV